MLMEPNEGASAVRKQCDAPYMRNVGRAPCIIAACRYRFNPGAVLAELKKRLKWAEGAAVKKEMDAQVG